MNPKPVATVSSLASLETISENLGDRASSLKVWVFCAETMKEEKSTAKKKGRRFIRNRPLCLWMEAVCLESS